MGFVAVGLFVAGVAAGGWDGNTIAGWGQVLIGVAAVIAALAGLRNGTRIKKAEGKADVAAGHASDAAASSAAAVRTLGPENGKTLRAILNETHGTVERIVKFEEYQRGRNHDLLNALAELTVAVPVLVILAERLLDRLTEPEDQP